MKMILFCSLLAITTTANANNISLTNISVLNNGTNTGKIIEFDISWDNSWRVTSTGNYDGAWVFFKLKDYDGKWKHLNFTGTDINMPGGVAHSIGNSGSITGVGMFIYRNSLGSGTFTALNVRAGIQSYPGTFDVKGFALEMVYIPQGSFYAGDGSSGAYTYHDGNSANPFQVTGNGASTIMGTAAGQLNQNNGATGALTGFPTGYASFWMMKYELSQAGYRDFLNTLTFTQQISRMPVYPAAAASTKFSLNMTPDMALEIATPGINPSLPAVIGSDANNNNIYNENSDGEWKAMGWVLNWVDAAAYLDWAGLRPMTELEYEKACRGPVAAVPHEYAWGNTSLCTVAYNLVNHNSTGSSISNACAVDGNANLDTNLVTYDTGMYRCGIFATATSTRISAGASYYGIMELTGNLYEAVVTSSSVAGRSYNGRHGDGILDAVGCANENYWPGINGNRDNTVANSVYDGVTGVTNQAGSNARGGSFAVSPGSAEVSYRVNMATFVHTISIGRSSSGGIRGVRD